MSSQINILDEITVDGFCGGGGWSTGMELALGEPVTIGINHDAAAIAMHRKNHPNTKHYNENIYTVDPYEAVEGRKVGWAHFSPDCTHFSVAKGGTPVKKNIRGLAWVVTKWAGTVKPRIISMENVKEFMTWGPLIAKRDKETGRVLKLDGTVAEPGEIVPVWNQQLIPDPKRKGITFYRFLSVMESLGYKYEWKILKACDYGAPTSRERLFIIFRRDGKPIVWPKPTHGDPKSEDVKSGKLLPYHTAAECIDWNEDITSIFDRKKPLAENTLKRIARGIKKFIVENPEPFIVDYKFSNNSRGVSEPLSTITAVNDHYLVEPKLAPTIMCNNGGNIGSAANEPLHTVTTGNRHFLVAPTLLQYHGETRANEVRGQTIDKPIQTVDTSSRYALTTAFMTRYYSGEGQATDMKSPLPTVTTMGRFGLATATMVQIGYGENKNQKPRALDINKPLGTLVSTNKHGLVTAFLEKAFGGGYTGAGSNVDNPVPTITSKDHNRLVTAFIERQFGTSTGHEVDKPLGAVTGKNKSALVEVFLEKYNGGSNIIELNGEKYRIVDIGMRMLTPRELYLAQGFPKDYVIEWEYNGKAYPKTQQVAKAGNSVPPPFATALVRANWPERCVKPLKTMAELNEMIYGSELR